MLPLVSLAYVLPLEDVQSLPDFAPTRQKSRVGEQQPVRASGGRTPRQRERGELSFFWDSRGASVGTDPSDRSGETPVSGVRSSLKGDDSGRTRHLSPSHAAAHCTCEQRPSVDQARDNLDQAVARSVSVRTARPLFTLVLARTVRQMLWGQCRSEIEGGPGDVKKSLTSPWFSHASWASLKGFIVAHPDRRSCQPPWEDLIVRKVLPSFMENSQVRG